MRTVAATIAVSLVSFLCTAHAAEMQVEKSRDSPVYVLTIKGEIERSDGDKFEKIVDRLPLLMVLVRLDSPGGDLTSGLAIGDQIRIRGYSTAVTDREACASACALIWLAGDSRYMQPNSKIGFHAAYKRNGIESSVSSEGNALLGAYLNTLGLSSKAIRYVTQASPTDVQWLTLKDAMKLGINVTLAGEKQLAE